MTRPGRRAYRASHWRRPRAATLDRRRSHPMTVRPLPLAAALIVGALLTTSAAARQNDPHLTSPVDEYDLVKLVLPDADLDADGAIVGKQFAEVREIPNFSWGEFTYDPDTDGKIEIRNTSSFLLRGEGRTRAILSFDA